MIRDSVVLGRLGRRAFMKISATLLKYPTFEDVLCHNFMGKTNEKKSVHCSFPNKMMINIKSEKISIFWVRIPG